MGCSLMLTIGTSINDGNNVDAVGSSGPCFNPSWVGLVVGRFHVCRVREAIARDIGKHFFRKLNARFICFVSSRFVF